MRYHDTLIDRMFDEALIDMEREERRMDVKDKRIQELELKADIREKVIAEQAEQIKRLEEALQHIKENIQAIIDMYRTQED